MNIMELTHDDIKIEVAVADETALDGVPYDVWRTTEGYLVVLGRPLFVYLEGLRDFLPEDDVWNMVGRWVLTLVETYRIAHE